MISLESLPDAVVVVDGEGRIVRVNALAEALFGYTREEMGGQSIEMLIPQRLHDTHKEQRRAYQSAPHRRPMGRGMLTARHKSGREVPVEIMLNPDENGTVVAVVRDVTKRYELEQFRDEYMGYISHDLKNPLSVISLQARHLAQQLSRQGFRDEERSLEVIMQSASFIQRLVQELLDMAYLESDHVEIHPKPVELASFLKAVLERTVSTSDRGRVTLEVRAMATAAVEPNRIERVVVNFVQNAIKYSPSGSPVVVRLDTRNDMAHVSVTDRGPGLGTDERSYVFDKYRRAPGTSAREGLGLGLYISRKIVEAHGGRIGVESAPGEGSTFFLEVPLIPREQIRVPLTFTLDPGPVDDPARLRGLRVLLVDDEPHAVSALRALLAEDGFAVTGATSGEEALARFEADPADVVVLDVEMPGMSGLALLEKLRQRAPALPAVIMSGYMQHHAGIHEARETMGAAYVGKPVDVDELIRTLGNLFRDRVPDA
jgi:PAS domain S-box-containing protein